MPGICLGLCMGAQWIWSSLRTVSSCPVLLNKYCKMGMGKALSQWLVFNWDFFFLWKIYLIIQKVYKLVERNEELAFN